ncbi:MAG: hypothetical protein IKL24_00115, partial [Clostridia bacterium]|nr:hypothetical protein [Clostridia bacterium]
KGTYMYTYSDITDTAEFWDSEFSDGMTAAEYLDGLTLDAVKNNIAASALFKEYKLSFTEEEKQQVDSYIDELIKELGNGSRSEFNKLLGEYGINANILKSICLEEQKAAKVYEYLYGAGGPMAQNDEDYEKFYKENYIHVQMIYVENISTYATDDDGNRVTDENGYYIIEELEGEAKEEKDAKVKAVQDGIAGGEDFNELYEEYSELKYKNGQYFSHLASYDDMNFYYGLIAKVENAEIGEIVTVESEMGTCIMKKLELDSGAWKNEENKDFFGDFKSLVSENAYQALIESYYSNITVDESIVKKYSVKNVMPAYFF